MATNFRKPVPKVTALVVDDDREVRERFTQHLSSAGINTVEAEDGVHGLWKAKSLLPDVIATDLRLREMTGLQLCHSLREHEETREIPVIGFSSSASDAEIEAAKASGCISVLLKPCTPDTLLAEIRRVLDLPQFRG